MSTAVPVAFVGGHGRSGSTLLSRVLGAVPGFVTVGELCYLWDQGVVMDRMCGCGRPFSGCEFWTAVGADAFGGWDRVDARGLLTLRKAVERVRYTPLLSAPGLSPDYAGKLREYAAAMSKVYASVRAVSGADVVVDTSKYPSSAYLLRHVPDVDLKLVHLVRSVYGVCYSWMKTVARPDRDGKPMPQYPPARTAAEWSAFNFLLDALRLRGVPATLVHYEDFVAAPREQLAAIVRFLGKEPSEQDLAFVGESSVELPRDHSVAGNPMRFRSGPEQLRVDEAWRTRLDPRTRRLISVVSGPAILRYGYASDVRHPEGATTP
jgi:Sulfotransferase family